MRVRFYKLIKCNKLNWVIFYYSIFLFTVAISSKSFAIGCTSPIETQSTPIVKTMTNLEELRAFMQSSSRPTREVFADQIILKHSLSDGNDHGNQLIILRLLPSDWSHYFELQTRIAQLIPEEEKRPTIDVTFTTSNPTLLKSSIGIAGGTGPLSDAQLIQSIMTKLLNEPRSIDWNHFEINLFSSPPPRSAYEEMKRWVSYLARLDDFASRGHNKFYLASNTAHAHIASFEDLIETTRARRGVHLHPGAMVDLVQVVSENMRRSSTDSANILILGTLQAYKDRPYPHYLSRLGVIEENKSPESSRLSSLPLSHCYTLTNLEEAEELQKYIELAKSGKIKEAGSEINKFIKRTLEFHLPRDGRKVQIILGCTELPMVLDKDQLTELKKELNDNLGVEIEFINTEEIFANKIIQDSIELSEKTQ